MGGTGSGFLDIPQTPVATSAGPCSMPILYRDGSMMVVGYRIDRARVHSLLGDLALEPLLLMGKALALLCLFEYRDTTIGPYNEIGVGVYVKRTGSSPSTLAFLRDMRPLDDIGLYVASLPVNTHPAFAAGVELWGFPKYVAAIETSFGPEGAQVTLGNEFVFRHSRGPGLEVPGIPFITYTLRENVLIRTIVEVGHRVRFGGAHSVQLQVLGDGPTARAVQTLGLDVVRPTFAFRTDSMKAILPLGKELAPTGRAGQARGRSEV